MSGDCLGEGGSPDRVARGQMFMCCAEPKEHQDFRPGARPGGSATGMAEK